MPMDEATALGVLKEQILKHGTVDEADLDEDTLEYMAGTLAEGGDREDIAEAIGPFLLDMGCVEEEDVRCLRLPFPPPPALLKLSMTCFLTSAGRDGAGDDDSGRAERGRRAGARDG